ncbi:hypothetical protein EVAR_101907_1 [Eumeta japonica]|uniref:Uncharacterized protein n=1 Tax=Eumeta variegata TaxID=151549 RepID=A0A4C1TSB8_EUMVA|nr:hypothetical protein EVAR_101907_1 [Eumeta japonica]
MLSQIAGPGSVELPQPRGELELVFNTSLNEEDVPSRAHPAYKSGNEITFAYHIQSGLTIIRVQWRDKDPAQRESPNPLDPALSTM